MNLLLKYLALCFFINNPADLIPPKSFMWKNVIFYLVSGMIVEGLISDPADGALEVILRTIMAFSTVGVILIIQKKWHYYNQLYTAIFVCENFIMTLATATEGLYHLIDNGTCRKGRRNFGWLGNIFGFLVYRDYQLHFPATFRV